MTQCDGTAVYVDLAAIETELFFNRQILASESLVDFNQVHIFEFEPGFLERRTRGWHWAASHDLGIYPGDAPAHDASHGLETAFLRLIERHHDHCCAAVDDPAGITRGDRSVLAERRLQLSQAFHGCVRAQVVVF